MYSGVTLKFTEPPDAAVPTAMWRIYPFKGEEALRKLLNFLHSCYSCTSSSSSKLLFNRQGSTSSNFVHISSQSK